MLDLRRGAIFLIRKGLHDIVGLYLWAFIFISYAICLLKRKKRSGQKWEQAISSLLAWLGWGQSGCAGRPGRQLTAVLTVSEEDVRSPVLGSWWVLKVTDERVDRLWKGKKRELNLILEANGTYI